MITRAKGFTLIEVVMVVSMLGLLASFTGPLMIKVSEALAYQYSAGPIEDQARIALFRMTRELRQIRSLSDLTPAAQSITFTTIDDEGVTYSLSGSNLQRDSVTLVGDLTGFTLSYYDGAGAVTAVTNNIRYIKISITVTNHSNSQVFETVVFPRSFA
jgi:prepilin-type N-terminal cleavage/methylation domain-containing protein